MEQSIERYRTSNYDYPVLKIKTKEEVNYDRFESTIRSFLKRNDSSFKRKDSGTVFCIINLKDTNSFDHYFDLALKYTEKDTKLKTWGFNYEINPVIFISFKG